MIFLSKEQMEKVDLSLPFLQHLATLRSHAARKMNSATRMQALDSDWLPASLPLCISVLLKWNYFEKENVHGNHAGLMTFRAHIEEEWFSERKNRKRVSVPIRALNV